jgi:hypothetical protein
MAIFSFYFVDTFKIANGQFYRDTTHTYSEKICKGSSENGSRVCTNYFFTEEQYTLNKKLDNVYKILIVLALIVLSFDGLLNRKPKDTMQKDPIGTMQSGWSELMKENEKQRKDPEHGFRMTKPIKLYFYLLLVFIFLGLINSYLQSSGVYNQLFKIN